MELQAALEATQGQLAETVVALEAIQKTQAVLVKAATPAVRKAIADALVEPVAAHSKP